MNVDVLGTPRRRRVYLSEIQIALIEEGHSRRQLSRILNVIRAAINRDWIRYQICGVVRRQPSTSGKGNIRERRPFDKAVGHQSTLEYCCNVPK
jgi:hypothetical protein